MTSRLRYDVLGTGVVAVDDLLYVDDDLAALARSCFLTADASLSGLPVAPALDRQEH